MKKNSPKTTQEKPTRSEEHSHRNLEGRKEYESGAKRCTDADSVRFDLICPTALSRVAAICAEGARKYGDFNWCKGMPVGETLNHAHRHLNIASNGGDIEGPPTLHLAKACWNIFAVIHFLEQCAHHEVAEFMEEQTK